MSHSLWRLFVKFQSLQILFAICVSYGAYRFFVNDFDRAANAFVEANRNDLIIGDFRQAKINLNSGIIWGFRTIYVDHSQLNRVIELGVATAPSFFDKEFKYPLKVTEQGENWITVTFVRDFSQTLTRILILSLVFLIFNSTLFFLTRARLEKMLEVRSEQLRLKKIGEMAVGVAHDLRSPLSLVRILGQKLAKQNVEWAGSLQSAVEQIEQIAQNLLTKYKSKESCEQKGFSLNETLSHLVDEVSERYNAIPVCFHFNEKTKSDYFISGEKIIFQRALSNILNNAAEACDKESKLVTVEVTEKQGEGIQVSVSDNGKGIPVEILNQLTAGNFQSWDKENGMGVGLKSAFQGLASMGAKLKLNSTVAIGTTAFIDIPNAVGTKVKFTNISDIGAL